MLPILGNVDLEVLVSRKILFTPQETEKFSLVVAVDSYFRYFVPREEQARKGVTILASDLTLINKRR